MATRPNCDYLVSIEWLRYQKQWVPSSIFFASPYDNSQVEILPSLESLQSFSYEDILKNLKHSHSFMEEDESWDHNDIVRVSQEELEQFIKFHLLKDYLERENHGWYLVIGSTDLATYMNLDRIIPKTIILPCPVGTRLKLHGYASDRFADVEFLRTEAGFLYIQNMHSYFNRDEVVTPNALRAFILRRFKSFPSLKMKYNTTMVSIWARCQFFFNHPGIVPEGWKLDAYLQLKPLRHVRYRGKGIVTSLNELLGDAKCQNNLADGGGYV
ncbi:hypothetical protein TNCV_2431631 [Trichonephila clavipes]|nr:hypothetical protein TNCV_2431631 [Trichonephila clavipes]